MFFSFFFFSDASYVYENVYKMRISGQFSSFNILNTDSTRINFCYPHFGVDKYDELNKLHNYVPAGVYKNILPLG